eukprot:TRINITY_DN27371_c0_g1_i2.p1 TRINITY_DN27371_c0_g1~~TRINITY_DN27371_c0_g1_i2.p1  ORF type:complete len:755 (-),score=138.69 TRINITY_DN27371_c0_g1_i2:36-2300(-)
MVQCSLSVAEDFKHVKTWYRQSDSTACSDDSESRAHEVVCGPSRGAPRRHRPAGSLKPTHVRVHCVEAECCFDRPVDRRPQRAHRPNSSAFLQEQLENFRKTGTPNTASENAAAVERAKRAIAEKKRTQWEAEEAKASERHKRALVRKARARKIRDEHERHIRAEAARRAGLAHALESAAQEAEDEAVRDIEVARASAAASDEQKIASDGAPGKADKEALLPPADSVDAPRCVMAWGFPCRPDSSSQGSRDPSPRGCRGLEWISAAGGVEATSNAVTRALGSGEASQNFEGLKLLMPPFGSASAELPSLASGGEEALPLAKPRKPAPLELLAPRTTQSMHTQKPQARRRRPPPKLLVPSSPVISPRSTKWAWTASAVAASMDAQVQEVKAASDDEALRQLLRGVPTAHATGFCPAAAAVAARAEAVQSATDDEALRQFLRSPTASGTSLANRRRQQARSVFSGPPLARTYWPAVLPDQGPQEAASDDELLGMILNGPKRIPSTARRPSPLAAQDVATVAVASVRDDHLLHGLLGGGRASALQDAGTLNPLLAGERTLCGVQETRQLAPSSARSQRDLDAIQQLMTSDVEIHSQLVSMKGSQHQELPRGSASWLPEVQRRDVDTLNDFMTRTPFPPIGAANATSTVNSDDAALRCIMASPTTGAMGTKKSEGITDVVQANQDTSLLQKLMSWQPAVARQAQEDSSILSRLMEQTSGCRSPFVVDLSMISNSGCQTPDAVRLRDASVIQRLMTAPP